MSSHLLATAYVASVLQTLLYFRIDSIDTSEQIFGGRTLRRYFGGIGPRKFGAHKLPIFDDFATQWQLWGPISPAGNAI